MSDTQSLTSEDSTLTGNGAGIFVEVESAGKLALGSEVNSSHKRIVICDGLLAVLVDEITLVLGEIRPDRNSANDWLLHGKTNTNLCSLIPNASRFLDVTLMPKHEKGGHHTLVLLGERKNKERFLSTHLIKFAGRSYEIGTESSVYDKGNVLGKNILQITTDHDAVFTVSNLVRKIKIEGPESTLKPTPARAQVPNDCLDGTLSLTALSSKSKKSSGNGKVSFVVLASRTKSAGKNKFAIEWYSCNRKDELSLVKGSSQRLHEDSEPVAVMSDPRDGRSVFAIFNNRDSSTSSLLKLSKSSNSSAIVTWDFLVSAATMGWINDDLNVVLVPENSPMVLQLFVILKTDGHRSRPTMCNECPGLQTIQSPAHVISMATSRWRLSYQLLADINVSSLALASLCIEDGTLATEPESGNPYRIRAVGCPVRGLHAEAIVLEDIDRCFDGDFVTLSNYILKICLGSRPCDGCISLLSTWVKTEKLAAIEVYYAKASHDISDDPAERPRLSFKSLSWDKFRSMIGDADWTTLLHQRPQTALTESVCDGGTFTLEPETSMCSSSNGDSKIQRPMSASVCSSGSRLSFNSRIPMPNKSSTVMNVSSVSNQSNVDEEDLVEANQRLRGLVQRLTATLTTILDVDVALRNNLMSMHEIVTEVQEEISTMR